MDILPYLEYSRLEIIICKSSPLKVQQPIQLKKKKNELETCWRNINLRKWANQEHQIFRLMDFSLWEFSAKCISFGVLHFKTCVLFDNVIPPQEI